MYVILSHFLSYLLPFPPFSSPLKDAPEITNKMPDNPNIRLTSGAPQTITVEYDQGYPPAQEEWSKDGQPIDIPDPRITTHNGKLH